MNDWEKWRERVRDIHASGTTWWGWWWVFNGHPPKHWASSLPLNFTNPVGNNIFNLTWPYAIFISYFFAGKFSPLFVLSTRFRIRRLCSLQRCETPPTRKGCHKHDTKLHLMMRHTFWRYRRFGLVRYSNYSQVYSDPEQ